MRVNAGRDFMALVISGASGAVGAAAPANYMGLSADLTPPNAGDVSMAGEVTVGTLARHLAVYSHTIGQVSYALQYTFVSDQTITVNKMAVFNAPVGGAMVFESLLNAPASLVSGDQILLTEIIGL